MAIDIVCYMECHMEVDEKTAEWISEYGGQTYYVCSR